MTRQQGRWLGTWAGIVVGSALCGGCPPIIDWGGGDSGFSTDAPVDDAPVTTAARTPPPISGGTLIVSQDGRTAIASDPDRDVVWRVDLRRDSAQSVLSMTRLEQDDEPGRVVEDARGRIYVALRRGGAIAAIDPAYAQHVERFPVCAEPRGLAYDEGLDALIVGCTSGDVVTLSARDGRELRRTDVGNDVRDIVESDGRLYASRFRSAQLLQLGADGTPMDVPRSALTDGYSITGEYEAAVAWRTIALPGGGVAMAHQLGYAQELPAFSYYSMVMRSGLTTFDANGTARSMPMVDGVLPVDLAVTPDGSRYAVAYAGSNVVATMNPNDDGYYMVDAETIDAPGVIAVAFTPEGTLVYQTREPARIGIDDGRSPIWLPGESVADTGHEIFHSDSGMGVACASCHPEGREDGRTWIFPGAVTRRTQSIAGGVLESAPFHWSGDLADMNAFLGEVFTNRMGGARLSEGRVSAVSRFVQAVPAPISTTSAGAESVARGDALFHDESTGCASCHNGRRFSNDQTVDVGTGEPLQVPTLLGVGLRGPWMHDGCAKSLEDRFGGCGGDAHGHTSDLSQQDVADMLAYLETL